MIAALLLLLLEGPVQAPAAAEPAKVHALPRRPTIAEVQDAALARLVPFSRRQSRRWIRRSRAAAVLPSLRAEFDVDSDQGWKLDQEAGAADELSQDLGAGRSLRLQATWELDRLIFNADELRAARAAVDLERERERVLLEVTRLYFERLQLLLETEAAPASDPASLARALRLAEVEALLTAMTGLEFPREHASERPLKRQP
ncbi:MAG: hypothetical protein R3A51_00890 [Nannocystaceae bacterium]